MLRGPDHLRNWKSNYMYLDQLIIYLLFKNIISNTSLDCPGEKNGNKA